MLVNIIPGYAAFDRRFIQGLCFSMPFDNRLTIAQSDAVAPPFVMVDLIIWGN